MKRSKLLPAILMVTLTACSSSSDDATPPASISITGASVVTQAEGDPYVDLTVTTSADDTLTGVTVDPQTVAESVQLTSSDREPTPGSSISPAPLTPGTRIDSVELAAGQPTTFGPGAYGMWLTNPKKLAKDSTVTITLTLEGAGDVSVQAPVR